MEINLTVAQVYINILINRGFNQTEIARLSGVHRVTITNIANLFYSGTTSEQKIKKIINNLQLTNDEKQLIHKAMYHVPIAMQDNNETVNNSAPIPVTPVNTQVTNKVIHEINQSNVSEIINKYANSNGTCMFCNMFIQHNCTAGYYNGKFKIMCHQCWAIHRANIEAIPQY